MIVGLGGQISCELSMCMIFNRNVKLWRPGDQIERCVGSGLLVAGRQFRKVVGHRGFRCLCLPWPTQFLRIFISPKRRKQRRSQTLLGLISAQRACRRSRLACSAARPLPGSRALFSAWRARDSACAPGVRLFLQVRRPVRHERQCDSGGILYRRFDKEPQTVGSDIGRDVARRLVQIEPRLGRAASGFSPRCSFTDMSLPSVDDDGKRVDS